MKTMLIFIRCQIMHLLMNKKYIRNNLNFHHNTLFMFHIVV